ncbi:hypothetical protein AB0I51_19865 [Streptomyces sp. NPDC050549]|uniref:hypothetical protein n=1 Tax=Streptomyces sp. NPDC050549 TaxID=3155406 RepID=UPI0034460ED1
MGLDIDDRVRQRAGEILVRVVEQPTLPSHLILGACAVELAQNYSHDQIAQAAAWEPVSRSADFDEPYPVDLVDHAQKNGPRLPTPGVDQEPRPVTTGLNRPRRPVP